MTRAEKYPPLPIGTKGHSRPFVRNRQWRENPSRARRRGLLSFSPAVGGMCEANAEHTEKPPRPKGPWCFFGTPPSHGAPPQGDAGACARGVATDADPTRGGVAARTRRIRRRVNRKPRRCWGHARHGVADGGWVNRRGFSRGCRRVAMGCEAIAKAAPTARRFCGCAGGVIAAAAIL